MNAKYKLALSLRKNSTPIEQILWGCLRNRRLSGYKFRRQVVIRPYIVDFLCTEKKLIIEADGLHHDFTQTYDKKRDVFLEKLGFEILRFSGIDIFQNREGVCLVIKECLLKK